MALAILAAGFHAAMAAGGNLPQLAGANNVFGFNLLHQLSGGNQRGNIFVSPYSAATALQMAWWIPSLPP